MEECRICKKREIMRKQKGSLKNVVEHIVLSHQEINAFG
jgi:hypothetical protein